MRTWWSWCLVFLMWIPICSAQEFTNTLPYDSLISAYTDLAKNSPHCRLIQSGFSDNGRPIHLFLIEKTGNTESENKGVILINNGIHAGETCGIDASLKLAKELIEKPNRIPENIVLGIIPVYNVGGYLNRGCCSRANQNGPKEYGFRGNGKNLDLNRDFIKMDSKNAATFAKIFHNLDPDVFIDTHTSNGADYSYTMTLITSQYNKMTPPLRDFTYKKNHEFIYPYMEKSGYEMTPYVFSFDKTPESGIKSFLETPRYSSGYANLFHTMAFITEAHMLKPYNDRVMSTYHFLKGMLKFTSENVEELKSVKEKSKLWYKNQQTVAVSWEADSIMFDPLIFKGYTSKKAKSINTGKSFYLYDQTQPFETQIKYYKYYKGRDSITKPSAYILPQSCYEIVEKMKLNNVQMDRFRTDTVMELGYYRVEDIKYPSKPFEGHFPPLNVKTAEEKGKVQIFQGDYIIKTQQPGERYIIETLEPMAHDSWLNWNFFDAYMQQKEWFSDYVFDSTATRLLESNPLLKQSFDSLKAKDSDFANDHFGQLLYIYRNSPFFESTYNRIPVFKVLE